MAINNQKQVLELRIELKSGVVYLPMLLLMRVENGWLISNSNSATVYSTSRLALNIIKDLINNPNRSAIYGISCLEVGESVYYMSEDYKLEGRLAKAVSRATKKHGIVLRVSSEDHGKRVRRIE